ncbi:unnamed protein product [Cylindrotheca closterium]|uniref:Uncharacterized protein n=1 Tax=Cylindrotheca closterium TaxID=2856 RepID=A0AAD2FSR4_9STRA|nr:unnamed protein product [Cylindrotheca closterium]
MKSFRKGRSTSAGPAIRARESNTAPVLSARERMEAYNQSYNRPTVPTRSKRNPIMDRVSSKRNAAEATATATAQPLRPYSKHAPSNRSATLVTHHQSNAESKPSLNVSKSYRAGKSNRRLEFQQTQVQHAQSTHNCTRYSRDFQKRSSRDSIQRQKSSSEGSTLPSRQVSTGDETYSDAHSRLSKYKATMGSSYRSDPSYLVPLLAAQAYHIPGNTWFQDWRQFMRNNHPLFGICLHHKLHPIKSCTRMIALCGSILFGLVMTNIFYLFYLWNPEFDQIVMSITLDSGEIYTLTTGMLLLWTVGGGIHASFNLCLWYIAACSCCRAGGCCEARACCPSFGKHLIRGVVLMIVVMTVLVIVMRIAIGNPETDTLDDAAATSNVTDSNGIDFFFTDEAWDFNVKGTEEFHFVLAYLVQMGLSLFVYYPVFATVLMSGVLGCNGKVPLLGGRPYEVAQYKRKQQRVSKLGNWDSSGSPTYLDSYCGEGSDEFALNFSFVSDDRESAHEDDIEILWTPKAKREFERRRSA